MSVWFVWCKFPVHFPWLVVFSTGEEKPSPVIRLRLAEHKQYVKSKILDKPSGFHLNQPGHDLSHLSGLVLEQVRSEDPFVLRAREFLFIQKFDTYRNGLNKEP